MTQHERFPLGRSRVKAYIAVSVDDQDEIVAFGFFHASGSRPSAQREMARHIDATVADGSYRVIEVMTREEARPGSSPAKASSG